MFYISLLPFRIRLTRAGKQTKEAPRRRTPRSSALVTNFPYTPVSASGWYKRLNWVPRFAHVERPKRSIPDDVLVGDSIAHASILEPKVSEFWARIGLGCYVVGSLTFTFGASVFPHYPTRS